MVAIIGDSLSWEQYASLKVLLGNGKTTTLHQGMQHQSRELHMNVVQAACSRSNSGRETANAGTRLVYRHDDRLTNLTAALQETFPVVLILDTGAHYRNDTTLMEGIRHNIQEIKAWQEQCQH